jgi:hypothetical protein
MSDRLVIRLVVVALAASVVGGVMWEGFLASTSTAIPDQFDRLVNLLAGGLIAILAQTRSSNEPAQPVQVMNAADEAIPVDADPQP